MQTAEGPSTSMVLRSECRSSKTGCGEPRAGKGRGELPPCFPGGTSLSWRHQETGGLAAGPPALCPSRPASWLLDHQTLKGTLEIDISRWAPLPIGARWGQGRGGSHQFISLSAFHGAGIVSAQGRGPLLMTTVSPPMRMPISKHLHVQRPM